MMQLPCDNRLPHGFPSRHCRSGLLFNCVDGSQAIVVDMRNKWNDNR
jgi:hypothetical protein